MTSADKKTSIRLSTSSHFSNRINVSGNTILYKDQFKALGGKWSPTGRSWLFIDIPIKKIVGIIKRPEPKIKLTTVGVPEGFVDVIGDTFKHRNELKNLGGLWVQQSKTWRFRSNRVMDLMDFIDKNSPPPIIPNIIYYIESAFDFNFIFTLFDSASFMLKYPKMRLLVDCETPVVLKKTVGDDSVIRIYDHKNKAIGYIYRKFMIDETGLNILGTLRELSKAPLEELKRFGLLTGRCPFCYKQLSKKQSVLYGYGPVCARNFGLEAPY